MDTYQFLDKLLPTEDNYILWIHIPSINNGPNLPFTDLAACVSEIHKQDATDKTVYFAVGKHNQGKSRKKVSASRFKTLAGDLDVGQDKPYHSQRDAAVALLTAVDELDLPQPMLVSSGYGLHFYFPLTHDISAADWSRLSSMLHAALEAHGVQIDASKISDASMVLRPIGTHNKKDPQNWKPVELLADAPAQDAVVLVEKLSEYGLKSKSKNLTQAPVSAIAQNMFDAVLEGEVSLVPFSTMMECPQVQALVKTGGADAPEPLWRASLGLAKYCEDPTEAIQAMAGQYPDFDLQENLDKMEGWKGSGPPKCELLERLNAAGCADCKLKGKVISPATIAFKNVERITDPELGQIKFPPGYGWNGTWLTYQPPASDETIYVTTNLMYPVAQFTDESRSFTKVKLRALYAVEGWVDLELDHTALISSGRDFMGFIYSKGIWLHDGKAKYLRAYLLSYLAELRNAASAAFLYDHYGWQNNGSFLLGSKLYSVDGVTSVEHTKLAQQLSAAVVPTGSLDKWVAATALFDAPELLYHGFVFLVGLSGPMFIASNIEGLLVNMYSSDSGSGKTITGMFTLSAWGNPETLFQTVRDTENAIYKKFGTLSNLSAYIDEITTIEAEALRRLVYTIPQGRERERLTQSAKEFNKVAMWKMPVLSSSNTDLVALLEQRVSSDPEKARIMQLPLHRVDMFDKGGDNLGYRVVRLLKENYGLAGPKIIEAIMSRGGIEWMRKEFHAGLHRLATDYSIEFRGQDRFIQAGFILADMMGRLLTEIGLINFDYKTKITAAADYYGAHKEQENLKQLIGPDLVNQFLLEHVDKLVIQRDFMDHRQTNMIVQPVPQEAVARMEVAVGKNDSFLGGNLFINRAAIRYWCRRNGLDYGHLLNQLLQENVKIDDNQRCSIFKGVPGKGGVGQTRCLMINMASHPMFMHSGRGSLETVTPAKIETFIKGIESGE